MLQSNQTSEYNRLYEKYNKMSNEELSEIVKPESGYTELAMKVASDILQSDRTEYFENIKHQQQSIEAKQKVNSDDILMDIGRDIHAIKNMLLFFVILTVLGMAAAFYFVFIGLPGLL